VRVCVHVHVHVRVYVHEQMREHVCVRAHVHIYGVNESCVSGLSAVPKCRETRRSICTHIERLM